MNVTRDRAQSGSISSLFCGLTVLLIASAGSPARAGTTQDPPEQGQQQTQPGQTGSQGQSSQPSGENAPPGTNPEDAEAPYPRIDPAATTEPNVQSAVPARAARSGTSPPSPWSSCSTRRSPPPPASAEKATEAPATMYVVSKNDIRAYGYSTLEDVLKDVPGHGDRRALLLRAGDAGPGPRRRGQQQDHPPGQRHAGQPARAART